MSTIIKHMPKIRDVLLIMHERRPDERGYSQETRRTEHLAVYHDDRLQFLETRIISSRPFSLHGITYQLHEPQGRVVTVIQGGCFSVAVDLRRPSPTFGKWVGKLLSEQEPASLWTPPGFGYGFITGALGAKVLIESTTYSAPQQYILWNDPDLNIHWPVTEGQTPILSPRERTGAGFDGAPIYEEWPPA